MDATKTYTKEFWTLSFEEGDETLHAYLEHRSGASSSLEFADECGHTSCDRELPVPQHIVEWAVAIAEGLGW